MQAQRAGHRTNRHGVVAGNHLDRDLLRGKVIQGVTGVGAHPLLKYHQRDRRHPARCVSAVDAVIRGPQQQHPQALGADPLGLLGHWRDRIQQDVGRADHPVSVRTEGGAAPLGGRLERRHRGRGPVGRLRVRLCDGDHARVGPGVVGGQGRQDLADLLRARPAQRCRLGKPHPVLSERAGLVRAHHVHAGQALDGGQFLNQALASAKPYHPDRESDRGHEHQSLGHHRNQRAHHPQHRFAPTHIGQEQLGVDDQQAGRHQQVGDESQDHVDSAAKFGLDQGELAGLLSKSGGVGLASHLRRAVGAGTGHHETARHHLIPAHLGDRVGLAGQQRLVDLAGGRFQQFTVDDDLISRPDFDDVVEHHVIGRQLTGTGLAAHPGFGLTHNGQVVQCLLRPQFLDDADGTVGDDKQTEQTIDQRTGGQHDRKQHAENGVDPGEHVGADDVADAARGAIWHIVGLALGDAYGHLGIGESRVDADGHRSGLTTATNARPSGPGPQPPGHPAWARRSRHPRPRPLR